MLVRTLLGITFAVELEFGDPNGGCGYTYEPFVLTNKLVTLSANQCRLDLPTFAKSGDVPVWYSYETQQVTQRLPLLAYVEIDEDAGDMFYSGDVQCEVSKTAANHQMPAGFSVLTLETAGRGDVKWRLRQSGLQSDKCVVSLRKLNAAIGYLPNRDNPALLLPEEEWHTFVALIFIGLGIVYLLGDLRILGNNDKVSDWDNDPSGDWQKLFLLDGPLTALATSATIVFYEVESYAEDWAVGQQSVLLAGVVGNFALLLACLYLRALREKTPKKLLRMLVDVPIFLAILVPVMHASGNLLELGCIIANIMTTYVSQRHWKDVRNTEVSAKFFHQALVFFNVLVVSPAILLTIVHESVGGVGIRILISIAITIGSLATAIESKR